jgi:hypothetical protein
MSLAIAFKGPEGIVLAVDSRVTIMAMQQLSIPGQQSQNALIPATFDNATKLLKVKGQDHVGAVTYGAGAIGQREFRTASSYLPEFEAELGNSGRLAVQEFADKLSSFFSRQWVAAEMPSAAGSDMAFLIGGYDQDAAYGRIFEIFIPSRPAPIEWHPDREFGVVWGGQRDIVDRLILGFDPKLPALAVNFLNQQPGQVQALETELKNKLQVAIPYQFLPLQDCVDLSIFLLRSTITLQRWSIGVRGVGGAVDVATITRTKGFEPIQQKTLGGETRID